MPDSGSSIIIMAIKSLSTLFLVANEDNRGLKLKYNKKCPKDEQFARAGTPAPAKL
jgi:hypothetical protein